MAGPVRTVGALALLLVLAAAGPAACGERDPTRPPAQATGRWLLSTPGARVDTADLAVFDGRPVAAIWVERRSRVTAAIRAAFLSGESFAATRTLLRPGAPVDDLVAASAADGHATIAAVVRRGDRQELITFDATATQTGTPVRLIGPRRRMIAYLRIAAAGEGSAVVAWSENGGIGTVLRRRSRWQAPVVLPAEGGATTRGPVVDGAPDGSIAVAYAPFHHRVGVASAAAGKALIPPIALGPPTGPADCCAVVAEPRTVVAFSEASDLDRGPAVDMVDVSRAGRSRTLLHHRVSNEGAFAPVGAADSNRHSVIAWTVPGTGLLIYLSQPDKPRPQLVRIADVDDVAAPGLAVAAAGGAAAVALAGDATTIAWREADGQAFSELVAPEGDAQGVAFLNGRPLVLLTRGRVSQGGVVAALL
jgi:hypothetical protein